MREQPNQNDSSVNYTSIPIKLMSHKLGRRGEGLQIKLASYRVLDTLYIYIDELKYPLWLALLRAVSTAGSPMLLKIPHSFKNVSMSTSANCLSRLAPSENYYYYSNCLYHFIHIN